MYERTMMERMKLIYLTLVFLNPVRNVRGNSESSEEYLQKAIYQLQEFNVPSSVNVYNRLPSSHDHGNAYYNNDRQNYGVQRINMNPRRNMQMYKNHSLPYYNVSPNERVGLHLIDLENSPNYYEPPTVTRVQEPEALGFAKAELAAMYKNALEKGSQISLPSLTNALASGEVPQVTQTHVQFPVKQPLYQYYFFPLKTFMSEFKRDHGYKTIPAPTFDNTAAAHTTHSQLSSPLFVAISTFITTAIMFMMSILFLPKLIPFDILQARNIQDDFFYLSNIIANAIERSRFLDKFVDSGR
ncbi:uncharacterized protein LOC108628989 [Ceratina calcarata]|uniref:Uncharacterized protein LOC108628989 n=1 Tax=Ceratina calcarata TaxID=156304 RepID=A0AAJ7J7S4_9HYME|nr:uncharacterized protein LOC108628989 [Ceratina calcarata]XP_017886772.1 uncharacterized protein LOC108628989 [Ceratina calcarata]